MEGRKRTLTEPFEPDKNPFADNAAIVAEDSEDDVERNDDHLGTKPQVLVPPSLNIVPPDSTGYISEGEQEDNNSDDNGKDASLISNIFRTRIGRSNNKNLSRPKLSLQTASFSAAESSRRNVSPSVGSAKSNSQHIDLNDERLRRRSFSNYSRTSSRRVSNSASSTDKPPRSAKVLSLIAADDMDEFEDLQKGFKSAIDEEGLTWLPQLNKSRTGSVAGEDGEGWEGAGEEEEEENDYDESIADVHTPNLSLIHI